MARVLVVGADQAREQALLQRLRRASALPESAVSSCSDLDACDLLVIHDTPAMRHAAAKLLRNRPRLHCWVHDRDGRLLGSQASGRAPAHGVLDDGVIGEVLRGLQPAAEDSSELAHGSHAITRLLRERVPVRQGQLLVQLHGQPLLALDLQHEQAIGLLDDGAPLAERLAANFEDLSVLALPTPLLDGVVGNRLRQPLRPLLWQWGLRSTHWQALDARLRHTPVRLLRWPDFRVLGRDHDGFRLCSLLLKRALLVRQCAALLELDEARVAAFVHAAYLSGHARLEHSLAAAPHADVEAVPGSGLLARMWRSMRGRG